MDCNTRDSCGEFKPLRDELVGYVGWSYLLELVWYFKNIYKQIRKKRTTHWIALSGK